MTQILIKDFHKMKPPTVIRINPDDNNWWGCTECGVSAFSESGLASHVVKHMKEDPIPTVILEKTNYED